MSYSVVWFKRDLRLHDHAPLALAAERGPVLALYVIEPSLWQSPDAAHQHYRFILESLHDLQAAITALGGRLHIVTGEVIEVLGRLHARMPFGALFAHEETGNALTYKRDLAVARWCREQGVMWRECAQFGVTRRLRDRDDWQAGWELHMAASVLPVPSVRWQPTDWAQPTPPSAQRLGLNHNDTPARQRGGRTLGLQIFEEFLHERSGQYRGGISSPLRAPTACSRLSPYLAYGCLSLREVVTRTRLTVEQLPEEDRRAAGLSAFISRLYWHCHFIQKLESEPDIEWRNMHRGYDGLREDDFNTSHFEALVNGQTGWPLVDACVAMLQHTGWINFRMRAMLVSVAAYPLWLHWRPVGLWLARQFLDYEPGIHWSQMQMQSGTTGMNTTRIYNPVKQARDHDPHGHFVKRWLPWMRAVPDAWLFEPWLMPAAERERCAEQTGMAIPLPQVDVHAATRLAKQRLHARRQLPEVKSQTSTVVQRHGSRRRTTRRVRHVAPTPQLSLDL